MESLKQQTAASPQPPPTTTTTTTTKGGKSTSIPIAIRFTAGNENVEDISKIMSKHSLSNSPTTAATTTQPIKPEQTSHPAAGDDSKWHKDFLNSNFFSRKRSNSIESRISSSSSSPPAAPSSTSSSSSHPTQHQSNHDHIQPIISSSTLSSSSTAASASTANPIGTWNIIKGRVSQAMEDIKSSKSEQFHTATGSNSTVVLSTTASIASIASTTPSSIKLKQSPSNEFVKSDIKKLPDGFNRLEFLAETATDSGMAIEKDGSHRDRRRRRRRNPSRDDLIGDFDDDDDGDEDAEADADRIKIISSTSVPILTVRQSAIASTSPTKDSLMPTKDSLMTKFNRNHNLLRRRKLNDGIIPTSAASSRSTANKSNLNKIEIESGIEITEEMPLNLETQMDLMTAAKATATAAAAATATTSTTVTPIAIATIAEIPIESLSKLLKKNSSDIKSNLNPANNQENFNDSSNNNPNVSEIDRPEKNCRMAKLLIGNKFLFGIPLILLAVMIILNIPPFFQGVFSCLLSIFMCQQFFECAKMYLINKFVSGTTSSSSSSSSAIGNDDDPDGGDDKRKTNKFYYNEKCKFRIPNYDKMTPLEIPINPIEEHKQLKSYSGWMNEINNYDPANFHISMTKSVFLKLDGSTLRILSTNSRISKRAIWNEQLNQKQFHFTEHRTYNLFGCRVEMCPKGLARKRYFSRKYPIQLSIKTIKFNCNEFVGADGGLPDDDNFVINDENVLIVSKVNAAAAAAAAGAHPSSSSSSGLKNIFNDSFGGGGGGGSQSSNDSIFYKNIASNDSISIINSSQQQQPSQQQQQPPQPSSSLSAAAAANDDERSHLIGDKNLQELDFGSTIMSADLNKLHRSETADQLAMTNLDNKSTTTTGRSFSEEIRVLVFARCDREKEDWYRRFKSASIGATVDDQQMQFSDLVIISDDDIQSAIKNEWSTMKNKKSVADKEIPQDEQNELGKGDGDSLNETPINSTVGLSDDGKQTNQLGQENGGGAINFTGLIMTACASRSPSDYIKFMAIYQKACSQKETPVVINCSPTKQRNKREKKSEDELWKGIDQSLYLGPSGSIVWANVLIGRLLFSCLNDSELLESIQEFLQKKLSSIKLPNFMEEVQIAEVNMGEIPPIVHRISQPMIDERGIWLDADLTYEGLMHMTITTKLNLLRLKKRQSDNNNNNNQRGRGRRRCSTTNAQQQQQQQSKLSSPHHHHPPPPPSSSSSTTGMVSAHQMSSMGTAAVTDDHFVGYGSGGASAGSDGFATGNNSTIQNEFNDSDSFDGKQKMMADDPTTMTGTGTTTTTSGMISAIYDSNAESSGASSGSESDTQSHADNLTDPSSSQYGSGGSGGIVTGSGGSSSGSGGPSGSSKKLLKIVDMITASNLFQSATEISYIQKAMENMSTKIRLSVQLKGLVGRIVINIPPPPSDRIWIGFRGPPRLWITATPAVGEHTFDWTIVTNAIERRLCEEVTKYLVYPNMVDVFVPILGQSTYKE